MRSFTKYRNMPPTGIDIGVRAQYVQHIALFYSYLVTSEDRSASSACSARFLASGSPLRIRLLELVAFSVPGLSRHAYSARPGNFVFY